PRAGVRRPGGGPHAARDRGARDARPGRRARGDVLRRRSRPRLAGHPAAGGDHRRRARGPVHQSGPRPRTCRSTPMSDDGADDILYKKDRSTKIATLTLNRPDRLNAPTIAMRLRYAELLHQANIDDDVKVLVIRGAGDDLGSGQDLPEFMEAVN